MSRIFTASFASVYPHYVTKVERKGRTREELDEVVEWLTGFDEAALAGHLEAGTTFEDFFADARLNPRASSITGVVCGVRVEDVADPLMQKIRYLTSWWTSWRRARRWTRSSGLTVQPRARRAAPLALADSVTGTARRPGP